MVPHFKISLLNFSWTYSLRNFFFLVLEVELTTDTNIEEILQLSENDDTNEIGQTKTVPTSMDATVNMTKAEGISDERNSDWDLIMFKDSNLTKRDVIFMIYSISLRHNLSNAARRDIIEFAKYCANENGSSKTTELDSDYKISQLLEQSNNYSKYIFYCITCKNIILETTKATFQDCEIECPIQECKTKNTITLRSENFFIMPNVSDQIKSLLSEKDTYQKLNEVKKKIKIKSGKDEIITDVYSGKKYQSLLKGNVPFDFTFNFNTDGAPIFNSSRLGMWPIQLIINELPPEIRFKNVILAGLWVGKKEPNNQLMNSFMLCFAETVKYLFTEGVTMIDPTTHETKNLKFLPLCCCVDSVARPVLQNRIQFNGYYGCSWCYHPGVNINRQVKYPNIDEDIALRCQQSHMDDLRSCTSTSYQGTTRGVKGPAALLTVPHFDIVWGFPPDYMHGVLLGKYNYDKSKIC